MPTVSTYCSRNWLFTMASRKLRAPRFCVYQLGRGSEPVMVVGSMRSLVPRSMDGVSRGFCGVMSLRTSYDDRTPLGNRTCDFCRATHGPVSYTHLRAHETGRNLVCRRLLEKKKEK